MNVDLRWPPNVGPSERLVLFDGVCRLCGAWARFLIRFDRRRLFKLAAMQSDEGKRILEWHGLPVDGQATMVLIEGGRLYVRSTAFIRVMARLPFPWKAGAILGLIPRAIRDWLYDRVALNRYAIFGKYPSCMLPAPDHEGRFLRAADPKRDRSEPVSEG